MTSPVDDPCLATHYDTSEQIAVTLQSLAVSVMKNDRLATALPHYIHQHKGCSKILTRNLPMNLPILEYAVPFDSTSKGFLL
jgi:hypothetical protein